jgi:hypothetical protein
MAGKFVISSLNILCRESGEIGTSLFSIFDSWQMYVYCNINTCYIKQQLNCKKYRYLYILMQNEKDIFIFANLAR